MKQIRLNLTLSAADMDMVRRVAAFRRMAPAVYARTILMSETLPEFRRLTASGEIERFEQLSLFPRKRGKKG